MHDEPMTDPSGDRSAAPGAPAPSPVPWPPPPPQGDPGAALLARHLAGDTAAFEALVRLYQAPLYGLFLRNGVAADVADELFQETFLRVHQHGARYEARRPFRVWLYTLALNLLRSHFRKRKVRRFLVDWWFGRPDDGSPPDPPAHDALPEAVATARESLRWLEGALPRLPDGPRQALLLTQVDGLSVADAALALGVPEATVKTWVRRARLALADARTLEGGPP